HFFSLNVFEVLNEHRESLEEAFLEGFVHSGLQDVRVVSFLECKALVCAYRAIVINVSAQVWTLTGRLDPQRENGKFVVCTLVQASSRNRGAGFNRRGKLDTPRIRHRLENDLLEIVGVGS